MISVTKLRNGTLFEYNDEPWRVVEYKHVHLSRGSGAITVRARNLKNGSVRSLAFRSGDKIADTQVERQRMTFLFKDDESLVFMHPVSFEQLSLAGKLVGEESKYLRDGQEITVLFWEGEAIGVEIPPKVTLLVSAASPGVKGDTVAGASKEAVLETGAKIKVPLFINKNDKVVVDTRNGEYVERAS